ncbi:uroporphyrinogen-III C-methyltransferase [Egibacter rhizosphaerae]|uniref:uroporphyrinogen-III C-methyltransferase n=1 Tax=Egibacter rhizosphaerae TaxID=1670831 RepID=UPI00197AA094|nr:uroporphyrinogen-III C-methyltransferase [Egibacter rhizosphaerae]
MTARSARQAGGGVSGGPPFGGPPARSGTVALVGAGPGDPGLIGLRAMHLLETATFVAYDRLSPPEALDRCREDAELLYVGKLPDRHAIAQDELSALLAEKAREGHAVVRLKGGDPFVLARGSEEAEACVAAGVPFEVVPGVTSGVAAPAYAGIPVTHRGLAPGFCVVTGHEDPAKDEPQVDYEALARFPGTLLLYMGVGRVGAIAEALMAGGRPASEPVAVVQWGTTPRQRSLSASLGDVPERLAESGLANPAVIVVGEVAAFRDQLAWFERRTLHGISVLVPRTRQQASELSERLRALGAEPVEAPTIAIEPTREPQAVRAALGRVAEGAYDWIALTSRNGVDALWEALEGLGGDARRFAGVRLAAVGSGTAEALAERGLVADIVPEAMTTRGLADALIAAGADGAGAGGDHGAGGPRILLPRADIATPALSAALHDAGWDVDEVEAYRTVPAEALPDGVPERIVAGDIGVLAFASSSTVRTFVDLYGALPPDSVRVASIGPVTSETCRELGLPVDAEGDPHDLDGLVQAVVQAAAARR